MPDKPTNSATKAFNSSEFRKALGSFTTGVTIVTTSATSGGDIGLTANSFNSVSLDPPLVLWSLKKDSLSFDAFMTAEHFAVHILAQDQEGYSSRFASRGTDKFAGVALDRGPDNTPLLKRFAARFICKTAFSYEGGDHQIFVGEVIEFEHTELPPLLFHQGQYAKLQSSEAAQASTAREGGFEGFDQGFLVTLLGRAHTQMQSEVRAELTSRKLTLSQYYLISLLGSFDDKSYDQLRDLLAFTGYEVTEKQVNELIDRELLSKREEDGGQQRLRLSSAGQQLMMELASLSKEIENHAVAGLDFDQQQTLKLMLREIISITDPGAPNSWTQLG